MLAGTKQVEIEDSHQTLIGRCGKPLIHLGHFEALARQWRSEALRLPTCGRQSRHPSRL